MTAQAPHLREPAGGLGALPRTIWFLWLQGLDQAPPVVKGCFRSWQQRNPGWNLVLLSERNLTDYVDLDCNDPRARQLDKANLSDLIRLELLGRYGGVWVDATCYCRTGLDQWLGPYLSSGFFAFDRPGRDRLLSSWFLAAQPGHPLVMGLWSALRKYWLENDFRNRERPRLHHFVNRRLDRSVGTTRYWFSGFVTHVLKLSPYYAFHYKFAEMIAKDAALAARWAATPRFSAFIPHRLLHHGLLQTLDESVKAEIDAAASPIYKLTWKFPPGPEVDNSVLDYLLSAAGPGPGEPSGSAGP